MRSLLVLIVLAPPFGAVADVIRLAGGQDLFRRRARVAWGGRMLRPGKVGAVLGLLASQVVATTIDVSTFAYEQVPTRFGVGVLLPQAGPDRRPAHNAPPGIQLSVRF